MRSKIISVLVLTVFFLSLPFACGLFSSKEKQTEVFNRNNYTIKRDITVKIFDKKTDKTEDISLSECVYRQIVADGADIFSDEAVKAVACAICSDMLYDRTFSKKTHPDAFLCTDCSDCNNISVPERTLSENEKNRVISLVSEVIDTAVFYDGQAIIGARTFCSSGKTENAEEIIGKNLHYLKSKDSFWDTTSPAFSSEVSLPLKTLYDKAVSAWGCDGKMSSENIGITEKTATGSVKEITVFGKKVSGVDFCREFGIPSVNFTFEISDGTVLFSAKGKGLCLGLSEYGANCLAKQGYTYAEILKYYYSQVEIKAVSDDDFS